MSNLTSFHPFEDIHAKVLAGERLSFEDGVRLYQSNDLPLLGSLATLVRKRLNQNQVYYSVNLHLNYTNICSLDCLFCSFSRKADQADAYLYSVEEILSKVRIAVERWQINEVHIVGANHPTLELDYYVEMVKKIHAAYPSLLIKAFTAPEIAGIAKRSGVEVNEVLRILKNAGLGALPGGGAEIFSVRVRRELCKDKISAEKWLSIHRAAHELGLVTNATMLYGHIESDEERVEHVLKIRELQDETKGFLSFVPLPYRAWGNRLGAIGERGGVLDLKVYAVSRLLLDNILHLKAHWVSIGFKMAQVALSFGVDDLGGTNLDEKIFHEAGVNAPLDLEKETLEKLIRESGLEPCLVDSLYGDKLISGTVGSSLPR